MLVCPEHHLVLDLRYFILWQNVVAHPPSDRDLWTRIELELNTLILYFETILAPTNR